MSDITTCNDLPPTAKCVCGHPLSMHRRNGGKCESKSGNGKVYGCPCIRFIDANRKPSPTWFCGEGGCVMEAFTPQELWEAQQRDALAALKGGADNDPA